MSGVRGRKYEVVSVRVWRWLVLGLGCRGYRGGVGAGRCCRSHPRMSASVSASVFGVGRVGAGFLAGVAPSNWLTWVCAMS